MYNIIAQNRKTKTEVIVENFIPKAELKEALNEWKKNGMSFCDYIVNKRRMYAISFPVAYPPVQKNTTP